MKAITRKLKRMTKKHKAQKHMTPSKTKIFPFNIFAKVAKYKNWKIAKDRTITKSIPKGH